MARYSKSHQKYRIYLRNSDQFLHSRLNLNLIVSFISLQLTMMFFFLDQEIFKATSFRCYTGHRSKVTNSLLKKDYEIGVSHKSQDMSKFSSEIYELTSRCFLSNKRESIAVKNS